MKHLGQCLLVLTGLLTSLGAMTACGGDAPPMGEALKHRDSMAVMVTSGCSMLYSDSGRVQFKVIAEQWEVYDKTTPPRHVFAKGLYLQRFSRQFTPDRTIEGDHFRSNEEMTRYSIRQTSGYMPAPQEQEGGAGTANIPPETPPADGRTNETPDTLPQISLPPRTQPSPRTQG